MSVVVDGQQNRVWRELFVGQPSSLTWGPAAYPAGSPAMAVESHDEVDERNAGEY